MGDSNAKVGEGKFENVVGEYGLGEKTKEEKDSLNGAKQTIKYLQILGSRITQEEDGHGGALATHARIK